MFDYSLLHWTTFLTAALLLNIAPGPDLVYIIGQTLRGGRRAGFAAMTGVWLGAFGHVLMAAAGLSVLLLTSATLFTVVKWLGAAYLVWLGINALRSDGAAFTAAAQPACQRQALLPVFRQGALVCLLNPKVAVFFLAFLPQFVEPGAGPVWAQMFLHGVLIIAVAAIIEPLVVLAAEKLASTLRGNARLGQWLERMLGGVLIALGVRLLLTER